MDLHDWRMEVRWCGFELKGNAKEDIVRETRHGRDLWLGGGWTGD